jgi:hypothetical protein
MRVSCERKWMLDPSLAAVQQSILGIEMSGLFGDDIDASVV